MARNHRVSYPQLESLWEALNSNRVLVTGYNKSAQARENNKKLWLRVEATLNAHGNGAIKDWKGWCKDWNDYKSKLKSKVSKVRASHSRTGGGPAETKTLTAIEKKILQILGEDYGSGLPDIRVDPFEDTPQMENVEALAVPDAPEIDSESILIGYEQIPFIVETEMSHQPGPCTVSQSDGSGCSIPLISLTPSPETPTLVTQSPTPPAVLRSTVAPATARTPRRSTHRRHKVTRREPITQEVVRRTVMQLSERNARTAERHCEILENLVTELKGIKEILKSRLPVPPIDGE